MGKTTIDFNDYEPQQYDEYDGDDPRPGWYTFELKKVGYTDDTEEALRWIFSIADGPYAGWPGFVFANFDSTKWKNQETLRAVQGGKEKAVTLDWANEKQVASFIKKAARVRGKVELYTNRETSEQRISLRKVRPLLEDVNAKRSAKDDDLGDTADDLEVADGTDEPYTEEELEGMSIRDLKEILKDEFEFSAADLRKLKKPSDAIEAILEAQDEDQAADDPDDDFDDDFEGTDDADDDGGEEPEPEQEPEPEPRRRRGAKAAAATAKKAAAPAQRTTRRRRA